MKKLQKKHKIYLLISLTIISTLLVLPIINGGGCDSKISYKTDNYIVSGYCKFGILDLYYLPKNKSLDENSYLHIKALYMDLYDNSAIYIYSVDDKHLVHNKNNISFLTNMKYERYFQFHVINNVDQLTLLGKNGKTIDLTLDGNMSFY